MLIKGKPVDENTRCVHYHAELDIIAIRFKCCNDYYPCYYCHEETAGHTHEVWLKAAFDTKAILCGNCKHEMTITEYKSSNYKCPSCSSPFNPKCSNHDHFYFE
ncbi:MAG: CHY zinc finger protein [Ferruginibacter sp.]